MIVLTSCQSKIDLSTISFQQNVDNFIKDKSSFVSDNIHPSTGLPVLYTYNIDGYNYGSLNLKSNPEENLGKNTVGFFLYEPYSKKENKIAGIIIEYNDQKNALFDELVKKFGNPQLLAEEPKTEFEGIIHGMAAYKWSPNQNYTIILTKSYATKNQKQDISTTVYIVSNNAIDQTDKNRKSVERLIQTYKE
ncbi:MAG: hypothetical protein ACTIJ9_11205 [Aequorivita sp.]